MDFSEYANTTNPVNTGVNDGNPSQSPPMANRDIPTHPTISSPRPQYAQKHTAQPPSDIDAYICIPTQTENHQYDTIPPFTAPLSANYNIFMAFPDLPVEQTEYLYAFPAIDTKLDTLTQSQMLKANDKLKFVQAQLPKLQELVKMDVFDVKPMNQKPAHARLLSSIWSYRRKRNPLGTILKYIARLCIDGSQQEFGRDYRETYAPVVSWSTIRLLLLLSSVLNLKT